MDIEFSDADLDRLESDAAFDGKFAQAIVKMYRKRMQQIRAARDERDFYALKSLHFEKLQGHRSHQHSMKINDQFRLVIEIMGEAPNKRIKVVSIEDYH